MDAFLSSFGPQTGRTEGRYDKGHEWADEFAEQQNLTHNEMENIFHEAQRAQRIFFVVFLMRKISLGQRVRTLPKGRKNGGSLE